MEQSFFKLDYPDYNDFTNYLTELEEEKAKFAVKLFKESSIRVPKELYNTHFFGPKDFQTKSRALEISKGREGCTNTVFGYCRELLRCTITTRTPQIIFQGLEEIYISQEALPTFVTTYTKRGDKFQWVTKYLGERHACFKKTKRGKSLHFYELSLKIDERNVDIENLGVQHTELF